MRLTMERYQSRSQTESEWHEETARQQLQAEQDRVNLNQYFLNQNKNLRTDPIPRIPPQPTSPVIELGTATSEDIQKMGREIQVLRAKFSKIITKLDGTLKNHTSGDESIVIKPNFNTLD